LTRQSIHFVKTSCEEDGRARGATVKKIITLADRLEGATESLGKEGIDLIALYTTRDLLG
jgi:orotate phosphoribosyltransferase